MRRAGPRRSARGSRRRRRGRRRAAARPGAGGRRCASPRAAPAGPCAARRSGRGSRSSGRRRRGCSPAARARAAKASTCTPFGMITASPPRCSTCTRRAKSDTAIRPLIRSSQGRTTGPDAASHFDRVVAAWKVATIGPLAIMQTSSDTDGGAGSCTWTTSKCPSRSQRRTRAAETGPNCRLAIEPLYGHRHGAPGEGDPRVGERLLALGRREDLDVVAHPAQRLGQVAHVVLDATGDVPLVRADQADAHQAGPGGAAGRRVRRHVGPDPAEHVPVLRLLGDRRRRRRRRPPASPSPTRSLSRPGPSTGTSGENTSRQPRSVNWQTVGISAAPVCAASSAAPPGIVAVRPKNVDRHAAGAEVPVDEQAGRPAVGQPLAQHLGAGPRPAGERDDPHAERLPVVEEAPVERLRLQPLGDGHERAAEPVDEPDRRRRPSSRCAAAP